MTTKHQEDDIRGNLVLKVGEVKEEKSYLKVRIGNNIEDVVNIKNQIFEECGQKAEVQGVWCYFGEDIHALSKESKFKSKEGGNWIDMARAGIDTVHGIMDQFPRDPMTGELFLELSASSDKSFKEGFYNSFNLRVSLDGSHEFAQNFGKYLAKSQQLPIHEKLLLNIIKKFKDIDAILEFDTIDDLDPEIAKILLLDESSVSTEFLDGLGKAVKESSSTFMEPEELARLLSKGIRLVVFVNQNMYCNIELKGEDAITFLGA